MKKIVFLIIVLFLFIPSTLALSKFVIGEKVPNFYVEIISEDNFHNGAVFMLKRDDGKLVYCIEPFQPNIINNYYEEYDYNNSVFNLTDIQLNRINLIAYYGYGYKNHTDIKWYGITQFLIWKELNLKELYFTDRYHGVKTIMYEDEINELESLVDNHYELPSITSYDYNYTINSEYVVYDTRNLLSNYEIKSSQIEARIENNSLYIKTNQIGNYRIDFIRKSPLDNEYKLYYLKNSQSLISPGKINDIEFSIYINVSSGSITVNKIDSENINRQFATLKGAIYGVYKDEELIEEIETNSDGIAYISNLPFGSYTIKELKPSVGYEIDKNIYKVELTYDNKDTLIESKENVIKGNIIINKYYGNNDDYVVEDDAYFDLYDINNNLINTYITRNGKIEEKLDFGKYYIIQKSGIKNYSFVDRFNIFIDESKDYTYDLYDVLVINEFFHKFTLYIFIFN